MQTNTPTPKRDRCGMRRDGVVMFYGVFEVKPGKENYSKNVSAFIFIVRHVVTIVNSGLPRTTMELAETESARLFAYSRT
jgi:hypothetical protein